MSKPMMTRDEFQVWAQQNVLKPKMSDSVWRWRLRNQHRGGAMICPCVFWSGYQFPYEEWCDYCLGEFPTHKDVYVWRPKIPLPDPDEKDADTWSDFSDDSW